MNRSAPSLDTLKNCLTIPRIIIALAAMTCSCNRNSPTLPIHAGAKGQGRDAQISTGTASLGKPLHNPPLRHLNGTKFRPGMRFWILTNLPPAGTVLEFEADHEFENLTIQDAVFLQTPDGGQIWQAANGLRNVWIEASK